MRVIFAATYLSLHCAIICGDNTFQFAPYLISEYASYLTRYNKSIARLDNKIRLHQFDKSMKYIKQHNNSLGYVLAINEFSDMLDEELAVMFQNDALKSSAKSQFKFESWVDTLEEYDFHPMKNTMGSNVHKISSVAAAVNWASVFNQFGASFVTAVRNQVFRQ